MNFEGLMIINLRNGGLRLKVLKFTAGISSAAKSAAAVLVLLMAAAAAAYTNNTAGATENYTEIYRDMYASAGTCTSGSTESEKMVYFTFDDGPSEVTETILRILDDNDIKATFLLLGHQVRLRMGG